MWFYNIVQRIFSCFISSHSIFRFQPAFTSDELSPLEARSGKQRGNTTRLTPRWLVDLPNFCPTYHHSIYHELQKQHELWPTSYRCLKHFSVLLGALGMHPSRRMQGPRYCILTHPPCNLTLVRVDVLCFSTWVRPPARSFRCRRGL